MKVLRQCVFACVLVAAGLGSASAVDYKNEFDKKVKASQNIGTLGNGLAGDHVNFYNGTTIFSAVDASVPGNSSLPVAIGRRYTVEFNNFGDMGFADWELDVPYISTVMTTAGGWISSAPTPSNRCSVTQSNVRPPTVTVTEDGGNQFRTHGFSSFDYWHGMTLHLPDGDQTMLIPSATVPRPTAGGPYYWNTNKDWWLACLSGIPGGGEGFVAIAPDGTKYWFNNMVSVGAPDVTATENVDGQPQTWRFTLARSEYRLYLTKVQDRFGNEVLYNWTGARLDGITSNDGRQVTINRQANGLISSISDGTRTTEYGYVLVNSAFWSLKTVTVRNPDPSVPLSDPAKIVEAWEYGFENLHGLVLPEVECFSANLTIAQGWDCYGNNADTGLSYTAYVKHPSGARVDFTFKQHFQFSDSAPSKGYYPLSLTSKTISGPGLVASTWSYGFLPSRQATRTACMAGTCPARIVTDEVAPDGSLVRRVFGAVRQQDESLLQAELYGAASSSHSNGGSPAISCSARWGCSTVIGEVSPVSGTVPVFYREMDYRYVPIGNNLGYEAVVGWDPISGYGDTFSSTGRFPIKTRIQTLQGATFSSDTTSFNAFAQPAAITRSSGGLSGPVASYTRTESRTYRSDLARWVIGLPDTVTSAGKIANHTFYDDTLLLPIRTEVFGAQQEALAYNANGTLASLTDGNGKVTTASDWYRGMPRSVGFPTLASMSAIINPDGSIASVTNEVTSQYNYSYDTVGRLKRITYPVDSPAWNVTDLEFKRIDYAEYGLPADHWRQTVKTGNGQVSTFFDGRWQPVLTLTEDLSNAGTKSFVAKRFDGMGRLVFTSYPVASANVGDALLGVTTQYDVLGRAIRSIQDAEPEVGPIVTATDYLTGFVTRVTNPRGYATTTKFQVYDSPSEEFPVRIDAPEGVVTQITRDAYGKPLQVTRSGPGG